MATERIRVLLVDDHASFAESLRDVLGRTEGIEIVGTAGTVADAVRIADEATPDVILMDQRLPDGSGAEATARVLTRLPKTAVIILTGGGSEEDMLAAVEAGACGYLIKTARVAEIANAVHRAAAGDMLIPPETLRDLLRRAQERARATAERVRIAASLTEREREVLQVMATAKDAAAIAEALGVSWHTARGYVQAVIEKLEAHSRLEAVLRAQELGILG
ncbi:MAG TPA: response regulator transcription factor [Candidatus Limnocylindria bacterium]